MSFEIDVSCQSKTQQVNLKLLQAAIEHGLREEQVRSAVLSITIVDNAAIHVLNKQHLNHDFPTDVISFQLDWTSGTSNTPVPESSATGRSAKCSIEGEIIVSAEYAAETALSVGWTTQDELTLYAIHGLLHICGYDDLTPVEKDIMRARERAVLRGLGLSPQYPADSADNSYPEDNEPPGATNCHSTSVAEIEEDDQ